MKPNTTVKRARPPGKSSNTAAASSASSARGVRFSVFEHGDAANTTATTKKDAVTMTMESDFPSKGAWSPLLTKEKSKGSAFIQGLLTRSSRSNDDDGADVAAMRNLASVSSFSASASAV